MNTDKSPENHNYKVPLKIEFDQERYKTAHKHASAIGISTEEFVMRLVNSHLDSLAGTVDVTVSDESANPEVVKLRKSERTKRALFAAARGLLDENQKDWTYITVEDIASRAGVVVGTVYNHFGSKDGFIRAMALEA